MCSPFPSDGLFWKVEMVFHEARSMHLPACLLARLSQSFQKVLPIHIIDENLLASIISAHDMVNRAGIFNAQLAGHRRILPGTLPLSTIEKPMLWVDSWV